MRTVGILATVCLHTQNTMQLHATSMHVNDLGHRQQNRTSLTLPKIGKKGHVSIEIHLPRADQGRIFAMAVVLTGEDPIWWSPGGPTTGFCLFGDNEKVM